MNIKRRNWLVVLAVLLAISLTSVPVFAQMVTATITGSVEDKSGGILKDADVLAANQKTGVEYPTKSNASGIYTITGLPVGTYVVQATAAGMKTTATNSITLEVGQIARVNFALEVGVQTEKIEVVGVNPVLQTENAVVGEVITGSTATALPLNGRNFVQLTLLTPGATHHDMNSFTVPGGQSGGRPYVNGQREQGNNFMLDGIDMNEAMDNLIAYNPSPDALAEVRVETNNYSAEFGNVAGAVVNSVMKSGSNEFHGNLFTFVRNDALDADTWANKRSRGFLVAGGMTEAQAEEQLPKAQLEQEIFGFTIGGPIIKNKVFFFADYQGTMINRPSSGAAIATAPASWRSDLNGDGFIDAFPTVAVGAVSPVAAALLADTTNYPLPNSSNNIYAGATATSVDAHQGDLKLDINAGANDNLFIRGSMATFTSGPSEAVIPLSIGVSSKKPSISLAANWTHSFSPTMVNELRLGYSQVKLQESFDPVADIGNYNGQIGLSNPAGLDGLSAINFGGGGTGCILNCVGGVDGIGSAAPNSDTTDKVYQLADKFSFAMGRNFFSAGVQFLHYNMARSYASNSGEMGGFQFASFDQFLLGNPTQSSLGGASPWTQTQNRFGVFVQDDIKIGSNLTVNLGVRYEYMSPLKEVDGRQVNYDLRVNNAEEMGDTGADWRNATADTICDSNSVLTCNQGGPLYSTSGGISPRLGFAYTVSAKTVVRGGAGLVRYMEGAGANNRLSQNPPFVPVDNLVSNPGVFQLPSAGSSGGATGVGQPRYYGDQTPQATWQWNLFVEQQLTEAMSLSAGYVGNRSTHLIAFHNIGQPTQDASLCRNGQVAPCSPLLGAGGTLPGATHIRSTLTDGKAQYDGLQVSLRHRRTKGLEFMASYTYSKAMQDNAGFYGAGWGGTTGFTLHGKGGDADQNVRDPHADWGPSFFDARHNLALSANYEIPVGKDRAVDLGGMANTLIGGWNLSAILIAHTGFPVTANDGWNLRSGTGGFTMERPNSTGADTQADGDWSATPVDPSTGATNPAAYLNWNAYSQAAAGTYGNAQVGDARGPGYWNVDMGLEKDFAFGKSYGLTLRLEAFNLFNHSNKGMPNNSWNDPTNFGTITYVLNQPRILELAVKFRF